MAFNIPDEVIKALKDKKLSDESTAAIKALKLEASQEQAVDGALTLLSMHAEKIGDKESFIKAFALAGGFPVPEVVTEKIVEKQTPPDPLANLPEDARKAVEAKFAEQKKEAEAKEAENAKLLSDLLAEKKQRAREKMTARAANFGFLNMKAEELAEVFMDISEHCPDSFSKIETALKAVSAQLAEGKLLETLTTQHGKSQDAPGSISAQVNSKVAQYKKDHPDEKNPLMAVLKENPDLYDQYVAEKRH